MKNKDLVFWATYISPHMSYLYEQLSLTHNVTIITHKSIDQERVKQGWLSPTLKKINVIHIDNINIKDYLKDSSIHIFCGIMLSLKHLCFSLLLSKSKKINIISEHPIYYKKIHILKKIKYTLLSILLRERIDNIFAMGELGVEWFKKNHFKENKIHQFQYFIECNEKKECEFPIKNNDAINFIYIGQFIDRKNVISTLNSFVSLRNIENWNLDLYGSGPLHHHMNNIIKDNNVDGKINIHDNISNEHLITKILPNYDYLILPSKFDGWGVVVNEALSQGVKVITNKNCGSSTLIEKSKNFGFVYETSLTDCISNILKDRKIYNSYDKKIISDTYIKKIQPQMVSMFLSEIYKI